MCCVITPKGPLIRLTESMSQACVGVFYLFIYFFLNKISKLDSIGERDSPTVQLGGTYVPCADGKTAAMELLDLYFI